MKKNSIFMTGMLTLLLSFGLVLAGCSTDGGDDDGGGGGGGGNKVTILNSTSVKIIGIKIKDDDSDTDLGYLVGKEESYATVDIAPNATYTSPEIKTKYVGLYVKMSDNKTADASAQDVGAFEVVADGTGYDLEEKK
jgi:hypothetical protein